VFSVPSAAIVAGFAVAEVITGDIVSVMLNDVVFSVVRSEYRRIVVAM